MNTRKIALILREKRNELLERNRPPQGYKGRAAYDIWMKYLREHKIMRTGIVGLTRMANMGQLEGKTTVQMDVCMNPPASSKELDKNNITLAHDIMFYVILNDIAEKILVLGLP